MNKPLPKLVILGTGWGGYSLLRTVDKRLYNVTMISPRNHFLFTPLLASTTVGTLEFRSIIQPVRDRKSNVDFRLGARAVNWDINKKLVYCESVLDTVSVSDQPSPSNFYVEYDKLVIAVGALPNTFGVKGVKEYAIFLKEVSDARKIRNRLLANFERSLLPSMKDEEVGHLLHTVIVGGGPTGVEFGAELYDFITQDVARLYKGRRFTAHVTLIESNKILSSFDKRLQAYAEKKIESRENFNLVKSSVVEVKHNSVVLKNGKEIPCGLVVWSTGLAPQPFTEKINVDRSKQGQLYTQPGSKTSSSNLGTNIYLDYIDKILTDDHLRVLADKSGCSYALGDCASAVDQHLPCTAQVAERQGRYLGEALNAEAAGRGSAVRPFVFKSMGMLAYIGGYEGLTDLPDLKIKGITSWFLWRSAYLTRLGSWRLRMQVPLDWLKTFIFGRDTSRFD